MSSKRRTASPSWYRALFPAQGERTRLVAKASEAVLRHWAGAAQRSPGATRDGRLVREALQRVDLEVGGDAARVLEFLDWSLTEHGFYAGSPAYFGLSTPPAAVVAVLADFIASAVNPQLSAHSHSPSATEIEQHVLRYLAKKLGLGEAGGGLFTSGGTEATHLALLVALARRFPAVREHGLASVGDRPVIVTSSSAHSSLERLAASAGLGAGAVLRVHPADDGRLGPDQVATALDGAQGRGLNPFLVVATAGSTATGSVDDLEGLGNLARREGCSFHVDAALGGALALSNKLRNVLRGIESADSVTFDPHKWLSVPFGCGAALFRRREWLSETFDQQVDYLEAARSAGLDQWRCGLAYSRPFLGARVFAALATLGGRGYAAMVEEQVELAHALRDRLTRDRWIIVNRTQMPVVCFVCATAPPDAGAAAAFHKDIVDRVVATGRFWLSTIRTDDRVAARAAINSFHTRRVHVDDLVRCLGEARAAAARTQPEGN